MESLGFHFSRQGADITRTHDMLRCGAVSDASLDAGAKVAASYTLVIRSASAGKYTAVLRMSDNGTEYVLADNQGQPALFGDLGDCIRATLSAGEKCTIAFELFKVS